MCVIKISSSARPSWSPSRDGHCVSRITTWLRVNDAVAFYVDNPESADLNRLFIFIAGFSVYQSICPPHVAIGSNIGSL